MEANLAQYIQLGTRIPLNLNTVLLLSQHSTKYTILYIIVIKLNNTKLNVKNLLRILIIYRKRSECIDRLVKIYSLLYLQYNMLCFKYNIQFCCTRDFGIDLLDSSPYFSGLKYQFIQLVIFISYAKFCQSRKKITSRNFGIIKFIHEEIFFTISFQNQ